MKTIAGKTPTTCKLRVWRELEGFDPLAGNEVNIKGTAEKIASVYGVSVDDVYNELDIDELLPCFIECVHYVNELVLSKLRDVPNASGARE